MVLIIVRDAEENHRPIAELCHEVIQVWNDLDARRTSRVPKFQDHDFALELAPSDILDRWSLHNRAQRERRRDIANLRTIVNR